MLPPPFSRRILLVGLVGLMLSTAVTGGETRTWSDRRGKTISKAEFIRVHRGDVILKRYNKILRIRFALFSDDDQDYVRNQLKSKGLEHLVPAAGNKSAPGSTGGARPGAATPGAAGDGITPRNGGPANGINPPGGGINPPRGQG